MARSIELAESFQELPSFSPNPSHSTFRKTGPSPKFGQIAYPSKRDRVLKRYFTRGEEISSIFLFVCFWLGLGLGFRRVEE